MDNEFKSEVKEWLEAIMPSVAATIAEVLTPETLRECAKEEAIHGPYSIDIDELEGPVTAIAFHVMVVNEMAMVAVNGTIRDNEDFSSEMKFDMLFSCDELEEKIQDETHIAYLVEDLLTQVETGYSEE